MGRRLLTVMLCVAGFVFSSIPVVRASVTADMQAVSVGEGKTARISFSVKNASLEEVLLQLKQKTDYYFLYNSSAVRAVSGITLRVQNASVENILAACLKATPFEYTIKDNTIVIETAGDRSKIRLARWAIQANNTANERLAEEKAKALEEKKAAKGK